MNQSRRRPRRPRGATSVRMISSRRHLLFPFVLVVLAAALPCPLVAAQDGDPVAQLRGLHSQLRAGSIDLYARIDHGKSVSGVMTYTDGEPLAAVASLLQDVAASSHPEARTVLLQTAVMRLDRDPAAERRRFRDQQPWVVRRLAAEALAGSADPELDSWLSAVVLTDRNSRDGAARRALAARLLAERGAAASEPRIAAMLLDPAPEVRAAAARALGRLGIGESLGALPQTLGDDDREVRLEGLLAIEAIATRDGSEPARVAALAAGRRGLEDPDWRVRRAAAALLSRIRDAASVPPLLAALAREQPAYRGARRIVRSSLREALGAVTGADFPSTRPEDWNAWWLGNAERFALPLEARILAREQGPRFFGLPLESDEVLFLLDASGSMRQPLPSDRGGPIRYLMAARELERCLANMPDGTRFDVVLFGEGLTRFADRPLPLDDVARARVSEFVRGVEPGGGTDLFGALATGLRLDGDGRDGIGDFDTLVLLSDGLPSRGDVLLAEQIRHEVGEALRGHGLVLHTVSLGGRGESLLAELAALGNGEHVSLETP
jgi:hypothetical protein